MTEQTDLAALVKPLVWEDKAYKYPAGDEYINPVAGDYRISDDRVFGMGGFFVVRCELDRMGPFPTEEAAKAAAQADYEARTLSALTVIDAKALVKAALERAADIISAECFSLPSGDASRSYNAGVRDAISAFRSLADDPDVVAEIVQQVKGEGDEN